MFTANSMGIILGACGMVIRDEASLISRGLCGTY